WSPTTWTRPRRSETASPSWTVPEGASWVSGPHPKPTVHNFCPPTRAPPGRPCDPLVEPPILPPPGRGRRPDGGLRTTARRMLVGDLDLIEHRRCKRRFLRHAQSRLSADHRR